MAKRNDRRGETESQTSKQFHYLGRSQIRIEPANNSAAGFMMTSTNEQDAFELVIERHKKGASENDIRYAFQRFMEIAGITTASEMSTEGPPGIGNPGRMDLYVHNTCIEFKTNNIRDGMPIPEYVSQLDGYLENLLKAGTGVRNGILTDGVHYSLRRVGDEKLPLRRSAILAIFDRAEQAPRVREYLHEIISAPAENVLPTAENLRKHFGSESDAFRAGNLLLRDAYEIHRDNPTVSVKRRLWQDLLQVALGKDAATAGDESDWLFIRHTYITSLIAVIMQQQLLGDVARHASERPDALLKGHILAEQSDLHGVVDADLFTWPTEVGENAYLREIARVAEQFDWSKGAIEVAPTLYQNVITQEERKKLGEYYTPRWLAKEVTDVVVTDPLNQRVLDPACGSGTFIETAVERILSHATKLSATETLQKLQQNVVGIDIHPVAVQLAKATWVLAASDTIRAARAEGIGPNSVTPPIYLGDSLQLRYNTGTLFASETIELETREVLPGQSSQVVFRIPKELARQQADVDQLISEIAAAIDEGRDTERITRGFQMSTECRSTVNVVVASMKELHSADRNHVWAYYIRNMIRPAVIAEEKVDCIIGNPPWLTYRESSDIVRQELRGMSQNRFQIWAGGKQAPHQDIATLFYTRCVELYAKPHAVVGMVMPHSSLRTGQHLKWRGGNYKRMGGVDAPRIGLNFRVHEPWDLDNVVPDFFPMPACVVFAQFTGAKEGTALAPATVQIWRGNWLEDFDGMVRTSELLHHDDGAFKSPYAGLSSQGPTIVDRRLFFVESVPHTAMLPASNTTNVKVRLGNQDKLTYDGQLNRLNGVVHQDHLFDIYLGECLTAYVALDPLKAALPVQRSSMTIPLNHDDCDEGKHDACKLEVSALHPTMRRRWVNASEMFREAHDAQQIKDLYTRLNYQSSLTHQLEYLRSAIDLDGATRVAYTTSGEPYAAIIRNDSAIVESSLYQTACQSENEAFYLLAIVNSVEFAKRAKPFCPSNWAKKIRHLHKHGWKLPIPSFDADEPLHAELAELGRSAEKECKALIEQLDILDKPPGSSQSRPARRLIRSTWETSSTTAQEIEAGVDRLLSDSTQNALAKRQITD